MKSFIPLISREWRLLLFGFLLQFGSSPGQTYFIALFSGNIRDDLGLSHGDFGAVYSLATLLSAVILLWSGSLLDRMDLRRFAYLVVSGLALGCLAMSFSQNPSMLFFSVLLLRQFGQGLMFMAGTTTMVRYLDQDKGKANALSSVGISVSEALLPSLVVVSLLLLDWRWFWALLALFMSTLAPLMVYWLLRDHDRRHKEYLDTLVADDRVDRSGVEPVGPGRKQWTRGEVICDPLFYLFMPAITAQPLLFTGFMFHQVHLVEEKGWTLAFWGSLYLLYAATAVAVKLAAGLLVDRFGAIRLVPLMCLPMGLGLFALGSSGSMLVAALFMICIGISVGAGSVVSAPFFSERYGNRHLGAIKSLALFAMVFMSALSPVAMGWLIDAGVNMDRLALAAAGYVLLASVLAAYACLGAGSRSPGNGRR